MSGVAPWLQRHWDIRAACNFIGGGTGTGLLLVSAIAALFGAPLMWATLAGLAFVAFGLSMVWLELGRPWRFINVLFHPKTSWMTREAIVAAPLFGFGLLTAWLGWPALGIVTAAFAMVFLYCQGRILKAAKGIPAWRTPFIVPFILATGLTEGAGVFMVVGWIAFPEAMASVGPVAMALLLVLIAGRIVAWRGYRKELAAGNAPEKALAVLASAETIVTVSGHILPVVALLAALLVPAAEVALSVVAGILAAAGGWYAKHTIVTRAAYNQGFAIVHSPRRGSGTSGPGAKPGWPAKSS